MTDDNCVTDLSNGRIHLHSYYINYGMDPKVVYKGTASHTTKGVKCLNWSEANNPKFEHLESNYCRTPKSPSMLGRNPWCYIGKEGKTDRFTQGVRWDYCSCKTSENLVQELDNSSDDKTCQVAREERHVCGWPERSFAGIEEDDCLERFGGTCCFNPSVGTNLVDSYLQCFHKPGKTGKHQSLL